MPTEATEQPVQWGLRWRHRKGGTYRVIATGRIEADLTPCVIYVSEQDGRAPSSTTDGSPALMMSPPMNSPAPASDDTPIGGYAAREIEKLLQEPTT